MAINRGKKFEQVVKDAFLKVPGVSIDRLHDQTNGYLGSSNICDFIVYKKPYEYYIECKSVHGNTLSIYSKDEKHRYGNITNIQWEGLLEKSEIKGVFAGILCWWVDKDVTLFIPIQELKAGRNKGYKSIRYDSQSPYIVEIPGKKKRVFFDYYMNIFFNIMESTYIYG